MVSEVRRTHTFLSTAPALCGMRASAGRAVDRAHVVQELLRATEPLLIAEAAEVRPVPRLVVRAQLVARRVRRAAVAAVVHCRSGAVVPEGVSLSDHLPRCGSASQVPAQPKSQRKPWPRFR